MTDENELFVYITVLAFSCWFTPDDFVLLKTVGFCLIGETLEKTLMVVEVIVNL